MKSLSILPMFLLLAACLSAQPQQAPPARATAVDNIVYLIDAYAEQKYGMACLSDERLDSVFYDLVSAAHDISSDEFKKRVDSTFSQRMKSQPLLKADGRYSRATPSMFMHTYMEIYRNYLLLKQPSFMQDTVSALKGLDYVYYTRRSKLMELARAYAVIKYFYPYISCVSNSLFCALKETVIFYLASAFEREEYQVAFSGYYGFEYEWFLFKMTFDLNEQDLVGYFIFKIGHPVIMQAFPVRERIDEFEYIFESRNSDEFSLLSTKRYKLSARLSYDDASFRVSFPDETSTSWPLEKIGSLNLQSLHQLIMGSCSEVKAAILGNICHRLSYSAYSGTIYIYRRNGETLERKSKNIPISQEVERMVLLRKSNRGYWAT